MNVRNATSRELTIAANGQTVAAGEVAEVDDGLGKELCAQTDVWRESRAKTANTKESD